MASSDIVSKTDLLAPEWMMRFDRYPLPFRPPTLRLGGRLIRRLDFDGLEIAIPKTPIVPTSSSPLFALDCEMCLTTRGRELTRVALVDESHQVLYDSLVKPRNTIKDYLTEYSGITPEMLEDVQVHLEDVQEAIISVLPGDGILVGHGLANDLKALRMFYPPVIDTSIIYSKVPGKKQKLKDLARDLLNLQVKSGRTCPVEDAIAAMKLVQLRLEQKLSFGDELMTRLEPVFEENTQYGRLSYQNQHLHMIIIRGESKEFGWHHRY